MPSTLRLMLGQWLPQGESELPSAGSEAHQGGKRAEGSAVLPALPAEEVGPLVDVDRGVLEELFEIMEDDFSALLLSFLDAAPGLIREIEAGILDQDARQVILPAHSLKSSSANVGAQKLSGLARQMEMAAKQGDITLLSGLFELLNQTFDDASRTLRKVCEQGLNELDYN
jgi:HPt (histidine-containing phosphotransfer) domain-containing protein